MYKEVLLTLSCDELKENLNRLAVTIDELRYCYDTLCEEKDELSSSNMMYKIAVSSLKEESYIAKTARSLKKIYYESKPLKKVELSKSVGEIKIQNLEKGIEESKDEKETVSQIISEEVALAKTPRLNQKASVIVPKLRLPRNKVKRYS